MPRSLSFLALCLLAFLPGPAGAAPTVEEQVLATLPPYQPGRPVGGTVRLWGHGSPKRNFMRNLVAAWQAGLARFQPGLKLEYDLYGTGSAIGALYTGTGDVALLGEEITAPAARAFRHVLHYPPLGIEVATGSVDVRFFDYAQVIFVHRDNPLTHLTLAQLDAVFGQEHRRSPRNLRTWGDLGLTGAWRDEPIVPYGWDLSDSFATYFQDAVLGGSHRWNERLQEFPDRSNADGSVTDQGQLILEALAQHRFALAISNPRFANPQVRALALGRAAGGPFFLPTKATLIDRTYPLTRIIPAYVNRPPGEPLEPAAREFLRYVLSREGQSDLVRTGGYLPLNRAAVQAGLEQLQ